MHRQNNYSYSFAAPSTTRYASSHSTSSAQSASANPDEDWTKISDLAERRRIQNRIAQRNYRKKLKRRLEDLERRAVSSSASPEQAHTEILPSQSRSREQEAALKRRRKGEQPTARQPARSPNFQAMQAATTREEQSGMFSRQYTRQLSTSPPPAFAYSYSLPELPIHAPYPQHAPFHSLPAPYTDYPNPSIYLPPLPVSLPSMSGGYENATSKAESGFNEDEMISHFNMSYSTMAGIEVPTTQSYTDPNAYTPPLSLSHSFDHSRGGSPCEHPLMPGTPISMPLSPHFMME